MLDVFDRLEARGEELMAAFVAELERLTPESVLDDPEVLEALRGAGVANLRSAVEAGRTVAQGQTVSWSPGEPPEAAESARLLARRGIPLEVLVRAYRGAHSMFWDVTSEEIRATGLDEPTQSVLLTRASHFQFGYFDHLISVITEAYTSERDSRVRESEQHRVQALSRVLAGEVVSSDELNYPLEGHHLAMVVRGTEAQSAARAIGAAMGHEVLAASQASELAWLWLGSGESFDGDVWERLSTHTLAAGVKVAVGESQAGVEGFRLGHRQAQTAHRASLTSDRVLTRYRDVALLAAVVEHETARATFVTTFLGELAGPGARNASLRETLQAYFSAGHNATSAAATLGVDQRTVRYRLRTIEETLGHTVDVHRAELEVALRMADALGATPAET